MSREREPVVATALLQLLLGHEAAREALGEPDWPLLARIAAENAVLIRCAGRLGAPGAEPPAFVADQVRRARARATAMLDAVGAVTAVCRARGIPCLFPKALQHHPDMGRDLDLLVLPRSKEVDAHLRRDLHAVPLPVTLWDRITGSSSYRLPGCPAILDVQHGRLGVLGEHTGFPATLVGRRRPIQVGGAVFDVPAPEDQLVLQGLQRVYGRRGLRLGEVVATILLVRRDGLDWDYVLRTSRELGVLPGLSCYLSYVDQIHAGALGIPLPCPAAARSLVSRSWGRVRFRRGAYRFPVVPVNGRLHLGRLASDLRSQRWADAGRLGLLPAVVVAALVGRVLRRVRHRPPTNAAAPDGAVA